LILELNRRLVGDEVWPYKILVENTHSGALASRCPEQAECELIFCSKFIKGACLAVRQACVFLISYELFAGSLKVTLIAFAQKIKSGLSFAATRFFVYHKHRLAPSALIYGKSNTIYNC
jgi:hypothetical protein